MLFSKDLDFILVSAGLHSICLPTLGQSVGTMLKFCLCLLSDQCLLQSIGCKMTFHPLKRKCDDRGGLNA